MGRIEARNKLFCLLATLLLVAVAGAQRARAQEFLRIAGQEVDITKTGRVTGEGINGPYSQVHYDHSSKTLRLDQVVISAGDERGIYSNIDGLTIKVSDHSRIESEREGLVFEDASVKIITSHALVNLTVIGLYGNNGENPHDDPAISVNRCELTIEGDGAIAISGGGGIRGDKYSVLTLRQDRAAEKMSIRGDRTGSITGFSELVLVGCYVASPGGAAYDSTKEPRGLYDTDGNLVTGKVEITQRDYPLHVGWMKVSDANAADILGDGGSASYNPVTKTLTLNGANVKGGIYSKVDGLTVQLEGYNTVKGNEQIPETVFTGHTTIKGSASSKLVLESCENDGIRSLGDLTIEGGCTVEVSSNWWGIRTFGTLIIKGSNVIANGKESPLNVHEISLRNCAITSPAGAKIERANSSSKCVFDAEGNVVKGEVVIAPPKYSVTVAEGIANGTLTASHALEVQAGMAVTLTATPSHGYQLKAGSLEAYKTDDESVVEVTDGKFIMPPFDVTVRCAFEQQPAPTTPVESVLLSEARASPNPFSATLELSGVENAARLEIYSAIGQRVYHQPLAGAPTLRVETAGWQSGLYLVKLVDNGGEGRLIRVVKR